MYISFCTGACSNNKWLRADYTAQSDAMIVKLIPTAVPVNNTWGYCTSRDGVPEQINVQVGGTGDSVVVSFVTFAATPPAHAPVVAMGVAPTALDTEVHGVTHVHTTTAKDRTYYMHFVYLGSLVPRTRYYYKVSSGGVDAGGVSTGWSPVFAFRSGYSSGVTAVDIYGDMGVYEWNNMANVYADCANGTCAAAAVMGLYPPSRVPWVRNMELCACNACG